MSETVELSNASKKILIDLDTKVSELLGKHPYASLARARYELDRAIFNVAEEVIYLGSTRTTTLSPNVWHSQISIAGEVYTSSGFASEVDSLNALTEKVRSYNRS